MSGLCVEKHPSILNALDQLQSRLGRHAFNIVDHWEPDLCAIGIASPRNPQVLVYVSCYGELPDRFNFELELPPLPGSDSVYLVAGRDSDVSFDELASVIAQHLQRA